MGYEPFLLKELSPSQQYWHVTWHVTVGAEQATVQSQWVYISRDPGTKMVRIFVVWI